METRLGITSKLYINEGAYGAPDWTEIDLIGDLTVGGEWGKGESTVRRARVNTNEPTTLDLSLTGNIRVDKTDDGYNLILDAHALNTVLDCLVLNGPKDQDNAHGHRFDGKVFNLSEDQGRQAVLFRELEIAPCASDNNPKRAVVTGGVLVYSDFDVGS